MKCSHTSNKLSCSFFPLLYISCTERPKSLKSHAAHGKSLSATAGKLGDVIDPSALCTDNDSMWVCFVPVLIPPPFHIWGKLTTGRHKTSHAKTLHFSSVFISMEQQSNYIYISATAFDTPESPESKEIKISQGFHSHRRCLWGRLGG